MEVFIVKYTECIDSSENLYKPVNEVFLDEVDFKKRCTELEDMWEVTDLKIYSGSVSRIQ